MTSYEYGPGEGSDLTDADFLTDEEDAARIAALRAAAKASCIGCQLVEGNGYPVGMKCNYHGPRS